jgi:hypothetical protein
MDDALPDEKNPTGLHFRFSKIDEATLSQGHFLRYRAYVAGAPVDKKYALGIVKIGSDPQVLPGDVYVNARGLLMAHKPRPDQMDKEAVESADELDLAVQAARGEPIRFALVSVDQELMVPGTIVPYPIENSDRKCRLELRLALPDAEAVLIYADGLPANSEVDFQSLSAGEAETGKFSVNGSGHGATVDMPYVEGKEKGTLKIGLDTKDCSTSVEIPWGKGSYHPL